MMISRSYDILPLAPQHFAPFFRCCSCQHIYAVFDADFQRIITRAARIRDIDTRAAIFVR